MLPPSQHKLVVQKIKADAYPLCQHFTHAFDGYQFLFGRADDLLQ